MSTALMPEVCPWCGADRTATPTIGFIVRGAAVYACGTQLQKYDALYQNSTPCKDVDQWMRHEDVPGDVPKSVVVKEVRSTLEDTLV